jgi:hypothetical protein
MRVSKNKVNLSIAPTQTFWQLTVSDNIAKFIWKLRALHVQTCSNAVLRSWVHNAYVYEKCKFILFIDPPSYFSAEY